MISSPSPAHAIPLRSLLTASVVVLILVAGSSAWVGTRDAGATPTGESPPAARAVSIAGVKLSRLVNVRAKGAVGNGTTNDTAALRSALSAAVEKHTGIYVPRGVYRISRLDLPDGVVVAGASRSKTWLKGGLTFGSHTTICDLKIGDRGVSLRNRRGATYTTFVRCRLRGGGGAGTDAPVVMLGGASGNNSLNHVTFRSCQVERNLGAENWSRNAYGRGFNNITVHENAAPGGSHIGYLRFIGCRVGVSNGSGGHDTGSPRAGIEVWSSKPRAVAQGWHHLVIRGCTFEATDRFCVDLADFPTASGRHLAGPALIEDNVIKGAGWGPGAHPWSYSICLEAPRDVTIRGNTIYAAHLTTIAGSYSAGTVIERNVIDLTVPNGVTQTGDEAVVLKGKGSVFRKNVLKAGPGSGALLYLKRSTGARVVDNRLHDRRTSDNPAMVVLFDASGSVISENRFSTAAQTAPRIVISGASSDNAVTDNTFVHQ